MIARVKSIREERRSIALLFAHSFGTAASYVLAKTIADSAFLSHIGPGRLPRVYLLSAAVVALSSIVYGRFARRLPLRPQVILTLVLMGIACAATPWFMLRFQQSLVVFAGVYLLAQVRGSLGTIQTATLINDQFGDRNPERVVGVIGMGATLAGILMGVTIGFLSDYVDVKTLMYLIAVIDLITIVPVATLKRRETISSLDTRTLDSQPLNQVRLWDAVKSTYVLTIACVVAVGVLASTLVEYQWKVTAAQTLRRDEESLAQYFGFFYGAIYLLTGLLQLFVTSRVLQRRGVLVGLIAFPAGLLVTVGVAWLIPAKQLLLWPLSLSKACDVLKRSFNDPSIQVVYSPLEKPLRRQSITLVAGIAKPAAEGAAAVLLLLLTPQFSGHPQLLLTLLLVVGWLGLDWRLWRKFRDLRSSSTKLAV